MDYLSIVGLAASGIAVCNIGEYCIRRHLLAKDVREGMTPNQALDKYRCTVDKLYQNIGVPIKLLPAINLATKHFKSAHNIE